MAGEVYPETVVATNPGLGSFIRTTRDEILPGVNVGVIWVGSRHKLAYRVAGGEAGLWQRCLVWKTEAKPENVNLDRPPDVLLGGEIWPTPTDWSWFGESTASDTTYDFGGQHHKNERWRWDYGVRVKRDLYTNGVLYTYSFDDTGDHHDYNDYVIEAAIVWTYGYDEKESVEGALSFDPSGAKERIDKIKLY